MQHVSSQFWPYGTSMFHGRVCMWLYAASRALALLLHTQTGSCVRWSPFFRCHGAMEGWPHLRWTMVFALCNLLLAPCVLIAACAHSSYLDWQMGSCTVAVDALLNDIGARGWAAGPSRALELCQHGVQIDRAGHHAAKISSESAMHVTLFSAAAHSLKRVDCPCGCC
jgi:hypothetical protein